MPRLGAVSFKDPRSEDGALDVPIVGFHYPGRDELWDTLCRSSFLGNTYDLGTNALQLDAPCAPGKKHSFRTAESAFQALKFWQQAGEFSGLSGMEAVQRKQQLRGKEDPSYGGYGSSWKAMWATLQAKFKPLSAWAEALLLTDEAFLLEHSASIVGREAEKAKAGGFEAEGTNLLGLQLMLLRDRLSGKQEWTEYIKGLFDIESGRALGEFEERRWGAVVRKAVRAMEDMIADGGEEEAFRNASKKLASALSSSASPAPPKARPPPARMKAPPKLDTPLAGDGRLRDAAAGASSPSAPLTLDEGAAPPVGDGPQPPDALPPPAPPPLSPGPGHQERLLAESLLAASKIPKIPAFLPLWNQNVAPPRRAMNGELPALKSTKNAGDLRMQEMDEPDAAAKALALRPAEEQKKPEPAERQPLMTITPESYPVESALAEHTHLKATETTLPLEFAALAKLRAWETSYDEYTLQEMMCLVRWLETRLVPPKPEPTLLQRLRFFVLYEGSPKRRCLMAVGALLLAVLVLALVALLTALALELTKVAQVTPSGQLTATSRDGRRALGGSAAVHLHSLPDYPSLATEDLRRAQDVVFTHSGAFHFHRVARITRTMGGGVRVVAEDGTLIRVHDGRVTFIQPWAEEEASMAVSELAAGEQRAFSGAFRALTAHGPTQERGALWSMW